MDFLLNGSWPPGALFEVTGYEKGGDHDPFAGCCADGDDIEEGTILINPRRKMSSVGLQKSRTNL